MKKVLLIVAMIAVVASAYCEFGSLQTCGIVGGHYEGVYRFNNGYRTFTFRSWCPSTLKYDFWEGHICY